MDKIYVLGYARKSPDDKEATESSILNQTKLIEFACKNKGWILLDIFIDKNITGSDRDRKAFGDMKDKAIESLKSDKPVSYLITKDQDRFARDSSFFSDTLQDLDAYNIKVYSILKNGFLSHEDLGDMVTALVDSNYLVKSRAKTLSIYEQKKEEQLPPFVAPFGYKFPKSKKVTQNWIIEPKKAEIVKQVCSDYNNKVSFKETVNRLKINKSRYYRIIEHFKKGTYNGWIVYDRKFKDSNKKIIRIEKVKYKGTFEPIINYELK